MPLQLMQVTAWPCTRAQLGCAAILTLHDSLCACQVYYHGGGYALGNLDSHDEIVRKLCVRSGFLIVSVDYRSAPACIPLPCCKMLSHAQRQHGWVGLPQGAPISLLMTRSMHH